MKSKNIVEPVLLTLIDKNQKSGWRSLISGKSNNAYENLYRKLAEIPEDKAVDIIITTHGGPALWCSKICYLLNTRSGKSRVFVKYYAHSAGAIIALCASELYITNDTTMSAIDAQGSPLTDLFHTSLHKLAEFIEKPKETLMDVSKSRSIYFRQTVEKYINKQHNKELVMCKMHDDSSIHEQLFFKEDLKSFGIKYQIWNGKSIIDPNTNLTQNGQVTNQ